MVKYKEFIREKLQKLNNLPKKWQQIIICILVIIVAIIYCFSGGEKTKIAVSEKVENGNTIISVNGEDEEKNKKSKGTAFVYDENNDYYKMEINGIEFVCDSIHSDYEKHAVELAQAYEKRLPDIVDYLMPDIKEMFGITNPDVIANSLGKPSIDLDRGTLTYLEHTMDSLHIIEMEFDGIFTAFYNSCIDG